MYSRLQSAPPSPTGSVRAWPSTSIRIPRCHCSTCTPTASPSARLGSTPVATSPSSSTSSGRAGSIRCTSRPPSWTGTTRRTFDAYRHDLRNLFQWASDHGLPMMEATSAHLEMHRSAMEERGLAASTIDRRLSTAWSDRGQHRCRCKACRRGDTRANPILGADRGAHHPGRLSWELAPTSSSTRDSRALDMVRESVRGSRLTLRVPACGLVALGAVHEAWLRPWT
ncbi:MAG: site-specific integrase, partial [Acidimicrobiales bacterium]